MNVAIIDADLIGRNKHTFPNLACMKISAYWKKQGATVKLKLNYKDLFLYDKVFISKVFTDTLVDQSALKMPNVEFGGTGFYYDKAPKLPEEIEHIMPDYHLYDKWVKKKIKEGVKLKKLEYYTDYSIGFMTRGCIRQCKFCVNQNYKTCEIHSNLYEFLDKDRKYICLLDDNVFACKDWESVFEELNASGKRFQFKQGLDERLLTNKKCEVLFNSKWIGDYIFAFDNIKDKDTIERKLKLIRQHTNKVVKFYVLCAFNHDNPNFYDDVFWQKDINDLFERIKILLEYSCLPYVMRYKDYNQSPYRGTYINIASWCNQPNFLKKKSYSEWCISDDERKGGNSATIKYFNKLKQDFPDIADKYYNIKFIKS